MPLIDALATYFDVSEIDSVVVKCTYDPWLVLVSYFVAFLTSSLALHRSSYLAPQKYLSALSLCVNSLALGGGVWAMHFIGMLAFQPNMPVQYDISVTIISIVPSILASFLALRLFKRKFVPPSKLITAGVFMGAGIGVMHYVGMEAILMAADIRYDPLLFAVSIALSILLAIAALWLRLKMQQLEYLYGTFTTTLVSGASMAAAITAMHYTGMWAMNVVMTQMPQHVVNDQMDTSHLVLTVIGTTVLLSLIGAATNAVMHISNLKSVFENRLRFVGAAIDNFIDGTIVIDRKGKVLYFNKSAEQIFGWDADEIINNNISLLIPSHHKHRHNHYIQNFIDTLNPSVVGTIREVKAQHKNGEIFPIRLAVGHWKKDGHHHFVASISNVTEQRNLEYALRENVKQYRSLIANLPGITFREMTGGLGRMVYISESAKSITGFNPATLIGEGGAPSFQQRIHNLDLSEHHKKREQAIRTCSAYNSEYRFKPNEGEYRWFWEIGQCYRAEDNSVWIDGFILDITDQKHLESEMLAVKKRAEEAAQAKNSFITTMNYELRSPINIMLGLASVLLENETDSHKRNHLRSLKETGEDALRLLQEIADNSHTNAGPQNVESQEFSLLQLCQQVEFITKENHPNRQSRIKLVFDADRRVTCQGDVRRLKQMLVYLMNDALTATKSGVSVWHVYVVGDFVRFSVSTSSAWTPVFITPQEPTLLASNATTVLTQLVSTLRGRLWHEKDDSGTAVYVDVPLKVLDANSYVNNDIAPILPVQLQSSDMVVIDDESRNLQVVSDTLSRHGIKISGYNNLSDAIKFMNLASVQVVLVDAYLTYRSQNALQTLKAWQEKMPEDRGLYLFAMVQHLDPLPDIDWITSGFTGVIRKPLVPKQMLNTLQKSLSSAFQQSTSPLLPQSENRSQKTIFNDERVFRQWPTQEIYAIVMRQFSHSIESFVHSPSGVDEEQVVSLVRAAESLGLEALSDTLSDLRVFALSNDSPERQLMALKHIKSEYDVAQEQAYAFWGVREWNTTTVIGPVPDNLSARILSFSQSLNNGYLDEAEYQSLLLLLAHQIEPYRLTSLVTFIDNFEFENASQALATIGKEAETNNLMGAIQHDT